jgi:hypothetical protein
MRSAQARSSRAKTASRSAATSTANGSSGSRPKPAFRATSGTWTRAPAGGATEADDAGAPLEAIQGALTHTKPDTTLRYIRRGRTKKIGLVAEARGLKRATENDGGTA